MSIVRCPHCGTSNRAGSNFCNGCGTNLLAPTRRPHRENDPGDPPPPSGESRPQPDGQADLSAQPSVSQQPDDTQTTLPISSDTLVDQALMDQPWLRVEFDAGEEDTVTDPDESEENAAAGRLVAGLQGLLSPVRIATKLDEPVTGSSPPRPVGQPFELNVDQARRLRSLMSTSPVLLGTPPPQTGRPLASLRIPWIVVLLTLAIGIPALLFLTRPLGTANQWPGVSEAYATIESLPRDAFVLAYWAYDPATAGEMDLVAQPVIQHLLQRRARIVIVTLLPGGPPTARSLIRRARTAWRDSADLTISQESAWRIPIRYLTGGALALPLVGQNPLLSLTYDLDSADNEIRKTVAYPPDLSVVLAANAEEAQQWLELVQPVNHSPVVAVTSAGADPILRPYWDSRQLVGLVSGYDGAYSYQHFLDKKAGRDSSGWLDYQLILQNWGQITILAIILLGNVAAILGRGSDE